MIEFKLEKMINTTDDDIVELMDIDNANTDTSYEETSTTRTKAAATMTTHEKMSNNNNNNNSIKGEHSGVVEERSTIRNSSNRYPGYRPLSSSSSSSSSSINNNIRDSSDESDLPAICIELVGSRFLRRMVRILTVRR